VRYEVGLFTAGDTAAAAEGHFVHVFVERSSQRPMPIPPPIRAALERLLPGKN
jgi:acyl-CoA thioester hydrolase